MGSKPNWTAEETEYLSNNWGQVSIDTITKKTKRSKTSIIEKASRLGLGPYLEAGEYITFNNLLKALGKGGSYTYTMQHYMRKGLPIKQKKVKDCYFRIIYIDAFWDWAEVNRTLIDFSNMEPMTLGEEPNWLKEQRKADYEKRQQYKQSPWTEKEDNMLKQLLGDYKYTYRELSLRMQRTEGAIKRRMCDLKIKARPLKMSNHNPWTAPEVDKLRELYHQGHRPGTMANYICRSSQAISGKIERMIKEGSLFPRSEFRVSC